MVAGRCGVCVEIFAHARARLYENSAARKAGKRVLIARGLGGGIHLPRHGLLL
jgi:hypothetical protein